MLWIAYNAGFSIDVSIIMLCILCIVNMHWCRKRQRILTSMHSSKMRTARLLPVSPSMYCAAGKGGHLLREVSAPRGCVCCRGVCLLPGGICSWGTACYRRGWAACSQGVSAQGRCLPRGCVYPSMHWGRHPSWTEWLTNRRKNITFAKMCVLIVFIPLCNIFVELDELVEFNQNH